MDEERRKGKGNFMKYGLTGIDKWDTGQTQLLLKADAFQKLADIPWSATEKASLYLHPTDIAGLGLPLADDLNVWPNEALPVFDPSELQTVIATVRERSTQIKTQGRKPVKYVSEQVKEIRSLTEFVRKTVIVTGEKVPEGVSVEAVDIPWYEIVEALSKNPQMLAEFKSSPRKLEELVAGAYRQAGFSKVMLTPRSGDGEVDVIAEKWEVGLGTIRVIDQVKAYDPGRRVNGEEVRALYGVLMSQPATAKAFLTTTSDFAPRIQEESLINLAAPGRIELVNGQQLLKKLEMIAQRRR